MTSYRDNLLPKDKIIKLKLSEWCEQLFYKLGGKREGTYQYLEMDYTMKNYNDLFTFNDCQITREKMFNAMYNFMPSQQLVAKLRGNYPLIKYTFRSSTCVFEAQCTFCCEWISRAYCGVTKDNGANMYEGGLHFETALQKKYDELAGWTENDMLMCRTCIRANLTSGSIYKIIRPFKFYGDMPRNSVFVNDGDFCFNKTERDMFRK